MGLFDFTKKFRTGRTSAGKAADAAAEKATGLGEQTLEQQQALKTEIGSIYQPTMQTGQQAFQDISGFYAGNQQPIINQAKNSPFYSQLIDTGEQSIARNAQATGGFRSGSMQENLAGNSQNVLMNLVNQVLQGKQGIANAGFGATDAYSTGAQNIIAGQGATRGQIANIDIAKAAGMQEAAAGRMGMYGSILGGAAGGYVGTF